MTRILADAIVVVKWLVHDDEANGAEALALLDGVRDGRVQPPH